eukprot:COSAG01_NODE_38597_length_487_cov_3.069588_1_plen_70_part_10
MLPGGDWSGSRRRRRTRPPIAGAQANGDHTAATRDALNTMIDHMVARKTVASKMFYRVDADVSPCLFYAY